MTRLRTVGRWLGTATVVASIAIAPALAEAQRARPRGGTSSGGDSSGNRGDTGRVAVPRDAGGTRGGGSTTQTAVDRGSPGGRADSDSDRRPRGAPPYSRPRSDNVQVGDAVPRRSAPSGGGSTIIVPRDFYYGGFYPWGYGGFGLGGYWGGYYDPWYSGYYPTYYSGGYGYDGSVRLKVKPVDADVYVDGYYVGRVDEFDGIFQRLRVEVGAHRIEIREEGYEPLSFEVRVLPDRKITYEGELRPLP